MNTINNAKKQIAELDQEYAAERARIENETQSTATKMREEIKTCDFLIGLCDSMLKRAGLRQDSSQVAAQL